MMFLRSFRFLSRVLCFSLVSGFLLLPLASAFAEMDGGSRVIDEFVVRGNVRVSTESILGRFSLAPGQEYDAAQVNAALKRIYAMGVFSDVRVEHRGRSLIVSVQESPVISVVAVEGNYEISSDRIRKVMEAESAGLLREDVVRRDVESILSLYAESGYYDARVVPSIIERPESQGVDLVFEVDEGERASIGKVVFVGNKVFSDSELSGRILTSESGFLSWLKSRDVYSEQRLEMDKAALTEFYFTHGYIDFKILSAVADFDRSRNKFIVTFTVDEGEQYRLRSVLVQSNLSSLNPDDVSGVILTEEGAVYDVRKVTLSLEDLTLELSRLGYAFAKARIETHRDPEARSVDLTYVIEEGPKSYIERINIHGNTRTKDSVIRRQFDIAEGDPFNLVLVERAVRKLRGLQFFSRVDVQTQPGMAADRVVIDVNVEEQATGQFGISGGYVSSEGFVLDVSISERNLLGRGQYVKLTAAMSGSGYGVGVSFVEPYFMHRPVSLGLDVFADKRRKDRSIAFGKERWGGSVSLGFALTPDISFRPHYRFVRETISSVGEDASLAIKDAVGVRDNSSVGYSLSFDTVDDKGDAKNGIYAVLSQDLAGVGIGTKYVRTQSAITVFNELYPNIVNVMKLKGGYVTGYGGDTVSVVDAFLRGTSLVRGFSEAGLGPRDKDTEDALGGKWFIGGTTELRFPVMDELTKWGFTAAVFADAGVLSGTDLEDKIIDGQTLKVLDSGSIRSSVGASVLWRSPLGPLRVDFAYVLSKEPYDTERFVTFGVASDF